jgi:6-phosphofructokinase 1
MTPLDFKIKTLGPPTVSSPLKGVRFTPAGSRILISSNLDDVRGAFQDKGDPPSLELAGPREKIYFDPAKVVGGIVTCGGLCPGLNDVIRSVVMSLHYHYGVPKVYGFRYGYEGLAAKLGPPPMMLTPKIVNTIGESGGTILGTSRGHQDPKDMVDTLERLGVNLLFSLGGDGTLRGASLIAQEAERRGLKISVVGIPKTIDNDISCIQTSFGFQTAASEAEKILGLAHTEAEAVQNGISLVKLMGRDSGFIAAFAALANGHVNFCLIPEIPFTVPGLLKALRERLQQQGHALIVVAEGAGQDLVRKEVMKDASGNILNDDIGLFLKSAITKHLKDAGNPFVFRYFDPSYSIRAVPANAWDSAFCWLLGHNAVHAGMSGCTDMLVGHWANEFTHVPIAAATTERKKIDPQGWMWSSVMASTGQPAPL